MQKLLIILTIFLVSCISRGDKNNVASQDTMPTAFNEINEVRQSDNQAVYTDDTIHWRLIPAHHDEGIRSYDDYKIESKEDGEYFVLSDRGKQYRLSDVFDYGEIDLLAYKHSENKLFLIGVVDLYGSTYFVYHLHNEKLKRIGDLSFSQAEDVEITGSKQATFDVIQIGNSVIIDLLLDKIFYERYKF